MQKKIIKKEIYKKAFTIGLPIAFENMIYSLVNFIDVFMVGRDNPVLGLGTIALAGLGFANQIYNIFMVSLFGMNSGGGIFAAQYYGNKDYKNLKKCLGITIFIGVLFSFLFLIMGLFFSREIIGIFTNDMKTLEVGAKYFKIIVWTYPLVGIGFAFNMQLRAIGKAKYSFYSSIIGLVINFTMNAILIFGMFGFPALGVAGAAYATIIARLISTFYIIYMIYKLKLPIAGKFKELFGFTLEFFIKIMKISLPVFGHEVFWVIGTSVFVVIYGKMGTSSAAAIQIVKSISGLIFTLIFGLCSSCSAIIGNEIGAGDEEKAYRTAVELLKITVVMAVIIAITVYLMSPIFLNIMNVEKSIYPLTKKLFLSEMLVIISKSMSAMLIVGILRAGGDTLWTMFADLLPLWLLAIPITYFAGIQLQWSVPIVYLLSASDEIFKIIPCVQRLKSKKWINNLVKNN